MDIKRRRGLIYPIILGFVVSILVIFIISKRMPRVGVQKIEELTLSNNAEIYYSDISNNGNCEKIHYYHYDKVFQPTLYLYDTYDDFKALWNFFEAPLNSYNVYFGDINNDSIKESFVFTQQEDSVFLYILDNENSSEFIKNRLFITKIENDSVNPTIDLIGFYDLNSDKNNEFLFYIDNGHPWLSCNIFAYDLINNILSKSSNVNSSITKPIIVDDLNLDNKLEIYISTLSASTIGNSQQSQFIAFDNKLEYLFQPISFIGNSSMVTIGKIQSDDENQIAVLNSSIIDNVCYNNLMLFNSNGVKIKEKLIDFKAKLEIINTYENELLLFSGYDFLKINNELDKENTYKVSKKLPAKLILNEDINGDNKKEFILKDTKSIIILDDNFRNRSSIDIPENGFINSMVYLEGGKAKYFTIQIDNKWYMLEYLRSEAFFNSYLFYISVFIIISLIIVLITNLFKRKLNLRNLFVKENNEELLYQELEKNLEEGKSNINNIQYQIGDKKNAIIEKEKEEIKKYSEQLKNASKSKLSEFEKNIKDVIDSTQVSIPQIKFYPNEEWENLNKVLKIDLLKIIKEQIIWIKEHVSPDIDINTQIINHKDYINIVVEVDNILLEKELLKPYDTLHRYIKDIKGSIEIIHFAELGTIINTIIPVKSKEQDKNSSQERIRIILAEDHDVSLFGLMSLFKTKKDIEVVGMAKNGMEVLKMLKSKSTDIIITDISMPGMDGIELSEKIKTDYPDIKVIVFTMYLENWFIEQLINNGAMGFVSKNSKIVELVGAVRNVYEGNNYYCPQFKSKFGFNGKSIETKLDSLTKNDHKIMKCFANNMTKKQMAKELLVNEESLESLVANILLKLNVGDEDEIVRIAKKQKYISE